MKLEITSTPEITLIDGVACRIWSGRTEKGTPVTVLVHRLVVPTDAADTQAFDRELVDMGAPAELREPPAFVSLRGLLERPRTNT